MKTAQIILLSTVAACTYGVVHDQITIRVCLEYFSVAHPPLFHTDSPTLLALCWGVTATAGIGAVFGVILALVSQSPGVVPCSISHLARSMFFLLTVMGASAFVAGFSAYQLSRRGFIFIPEGLAQTIPALQHDRFLAVWFAHGASYLSGLSGGALLCFRIWTARGRPAVLSVFPQTPLSIARAALLAVVVAFIFWTRFIAS